MFVKNQVKQLANALESQDDTGNLYITHVTRSESDGIF